MSLTSSQYDTLDTKSKIGLSVDSDSLEATKEVQPNEWYAEFDIKRLTKATSFIILDETFYIAKKDYLGKASKIYHVYRVSDKRYITPSLLDKEETIKLVKRKYIELDL